MAPLTNTSSTTKDAEAVGIEKVSSLDTSHVPKDVDAVLTEEEKRAVKRAT